MFEVSVPIKTNKQKFLIKYSIADNPRLAFSEGELLPPPPSVTNEMPSLTLSEGHKIQSNT